MKKELRKILKNTKLSFNDEHAQRLWSEFKILTSKQFIKFAETWAKLMQYCIEEGQFGVHEVAAATDHYIVSFAPYVTGFQSEICILMLSECWKYGKALKAWRESVDAGSHEDDILNPSLQNFLNDIF